MLDTATMSVLDQIEKEYLNSSLFQKVGTENYFASVIDANVGYLATAVDGVGSKIKHLIKYEMYNEIGKDCYAMCYNDIVCVGANPVSFANHITSTPNQSEFIPQVISGIAEYCREGFTLLGGGETEILKETNFHISGSMTGILAVKDLLIDGTKVQDGDLIIGLESSGIHANGWTAISERMPELIEPNNLIATKLYASILGITARTPNVSAIVNITGGGFRNLERIPKNMQYNIKHEPKHRIFQALGCEFSFEELYTTFNMGVGMMVIIRPKDLDCVLDMVDGYAQVLGMVTESDRPRVVINGRDISGNTKPYVTRIKEVVNCDINLTDN